MGQKSGMVVLGHKEKSTVMEISLRPSDGSVASFLPEGQLIY
jgi:hypothetical protein